MGGMVRADELRGELMRANAHGRGAPPEAISHDAERLTSSDLDRWRASFTGCRTLRQEVQDNGPQREPRVADGRGHSCGHG